MPEIRAFRAWRYGASSASVYAPPYDVISKKQQAALYAADPHNVIRLELGQDKPGDGGRENKYVRAARFLSDWKQSGVLTRESAPAYYVYLQDYKEEGKARQRLGFFASMKIDEKAVKKHENTLAGPKKDRLALLKETRTNLSPIFGLFEDPKAEIQKVLAASAKGRPIVDVTVDQVRHRLFVETDETRIAAISAAMKKKPMFIADGHHRFEVACQYRRLCGSGGRSAEHKKQADGWNYVMTYFTDCRNNPFTIWPTHRLVKYPKTLKDPVAALKKLGEIERVSKLDAVLKALELSREEAKDKSYSFGFYSKKTGYILLTLGRELEKKVKRNPVDQLDVAVLHNFVVAPVFKVSKIEKSEAIDFTRDAREAVERVNSGEFDAALFLRPTSLGEMILASKKGLKMPQKSTYFYPKLLSGLVFHSLEEN